MHLMLSSQGHRENFRNTEVMSSSTQKSLQDTNLRRTNLLDLVKFEYIKSKNNISIMCKFNYTVNSLQVLIPYI